MLLFCRSWRFARYVANGIYYKFCIDEKGDLFNGSTTAAQKVGLCELRGVRFFFSFSQICFPLVCVIDHLGHRVVAETVLPISMDTLRVGCPDAARGRRRSQSFVSSDDDLLRAMNAAGRRLNLAGHYVKAAKVAQDGSSDMCVVPPKLFGIPSHLRTSPSLSQFNGCPCVLQIRAHTLRHGRASWTRRSHVLHRF